MDLFFNGFFENKGVFFIWCLVFREKYNIITHGLKDKIPEACVTGQGLCFPGSSGNDSTS
jgi:hypothetical protein